MFQKKQIPTISYNYKSTRQHFRRLFPPTMTKLEHLDPTSKAKVRPMGIHRGHMEERSTRFAIDAINRDDKLNFELSA